MLKVALVAGHERKIGSDRGGRDEFVDSSDHSTCLSMSYRDVSPDSRNPEIDRQHPVAEFGEALSEPVFNTASP